MGIFDNDIKNYIEGNETNPYGTIGTQVDNYIQGKNQPSYGIIGDAVNKYIKGGGTVYNDQTSSANKNDFLKKYGGTLFGGLGGLALGALDGSNRKNLIKSSYYKNPYLNAALTPEYSLSDNINNFVGMLGMYGGRNKNDVNEDWDLFKASLSGKPTFTSNKLEDAYNNVGEVLTHETPRYKLANEVFDNQYERGNIFGDFSNKIFGS